jgi:uncharacterized membrane protein
VSTARNVAIVLALAAAITFLPGGGDVAAVVGRTLSLAFLAVLAWGLAYLYRRHRSDLEQLRVSFRALLYGAGGVLVLAFAGTSGVVLLILLVAVALALLAVWQEYRSLA